MKVIFKGNEVNLLGNSLNIGDKLNNFRAVDSNMNEFSLDNAKGKKVFVSIPSIDTGVCNIEVNKFINYFNNIDEKCYVISLDLPFAFSRWCAGKDNKNLVMLSDFKYHEFEKVSGTYIKEVGLLTRAVFVVDENNTVIHVQYVSNVSDEPDYEKVLEYFK